MDYDMHLRNPTFATDLGPPTEIQPRLTGIHQYGRLVVIDNPISYVVLPGMYYPFLSLRGHIDPVSTAVGERLQLGVELNEPIPDNREPRYVTPGFKRTLSAPSTQGAVRESRGRLANTTLTGTGPEAQPAPQYSDPADFFTGLPRDDRTRLGVW
jgi:hypothetical protein